MLNLWWILRRRSFDCQLSSSMPTHKGTLCIFVGTGSANKNKDPVVMPHCKFGPIDAWKHSSSGHGEAECKHECHETLERRPVTLQMYRHGLYWH